MIEYLENLLGVASGTLTSDAGIIVTCILAVAVIFAFLKLFVLWFDKLFGRD